MGDGTLAGDPDDDYEYDQDGNMKADQNKEISYIAYNHANMPTHVNMRRGDIEFIYDALGNKWYKFSKDGEHREAKGTAYIFGMQYEFKENNHIQYDWKLMFIGTDEGYVSAVYPDGIDNEFKFQYVYNHTDHLGNIRQNITKENGRLTVLREHNYYPFGLLHRGYNENEQDLKYDKEQDFIFTVQAQAGRYKYKFQGQERQEDLNLGWDSFKYRNYDYAIGRFFNVDPLAEKFPYNSTYAFQENKLGLGRELEGLELAYRDKDGNLHQGPYNQDNVPNDWQQENQNQQQIGPENLTQIDLEPVTITLKSNNVIREQTVGEYYKGGDVQIFLSGPNFENETVITEKDLKKAEAINMTLMVFDVLTLGQMSAYSKLSLTRASKFNIPTQSATVRFMGALETGGNRYTFYTYRNLNFRVNSSHGYDRVHGSGAIPRELSYQQVESRIVRDAVHHYSEIPIAGRNTKPYEGKVNIGGYKIGYTAMQVNGLVRIGTYYPLSP